MDLAKSYLDDEVEQAFTDVTSSWWNDTVFAASGYSRKQTI